MRRFFPALLLVASAARAADAPATPPVLPFLEDDYGKALGEARRLDRPLFLEAWAPWCHTCRAMQAFVFTDRSLAPRAGQFVWLSIDTEKKSNAPVLQKYPVEAWPTLFIVDPKTETAVLRWVGGATVRDMDRLLDEGRRAVRGGEKGADEILARADRLFAQKRNAEAAARYREALSKAPAGWKPRPRAVASLVFALQQEREYGACAAAARDALPSLGETTFAANVAAIGLDCALDLKEDDPARAGLVAAIAADARGILSRPRPDVSPDDLSSLYEALVQEREAAKDADGRSRVLQDWAAFLEAQASAAKTPAGRAVYDGHRLAAYMALGEPQKAIPMLEASDEDFPDDYNPSARLSRAYEAMKNYEMALQASDKALSRAYGPRLVMLLAVRSRIYREKGDMASARIALEEAVREAEALPAGQRSDSQIASLKRSLEALPAPVP